MSGLGECGRRIVTAGRPGRCWRRAEHPGEHTPDGRDPATGADDRPEAVRVRRCDDAPLTDADRAAGRLLRARARARVSS